MTAGAAAELLAGERARPWKVSASPSSGPVAVPLRPGASLRSCHCGRRRRPFFGHHGEQRIGTQPVLLPLWDPRVEGILGLGFFDPFFFFLFLTDPNQKAQDPSLDPKVIVPL